MSNVSDIKSALELLSSPERKKVNERFFKTKKGEYGEGDIFIGVSVPDIRKVVKQIYKVISLEEVIILLQSEVHEHRMCAVFILVEKYQRLKAMEEKKKITDLYLKYRQYINNWDLVDASAHKILGNYCYTINDYSLLFDLSEEKNLWSQRIAIVSTLYLIKKGELEVTPKLVLVNIQHNHDLIHKANGWLLREMGKKDEKKLILFLKKHYLSMPRTTLRYAIEKLNEELRQEFLKGKI